MCVLECCRTIIIIISVYPLYYVFKVYIVQKWYAHFTVITIRHYYSVLKIFMYNINHFLNFSRVFLEGEEERRTNGNRRGRGQEEEEEERGRRDHYSYY